VAFTQWEELDRDTGSSAKRRIEAALGAAATSEAKAKKQKTGATAKTKSKSKVTSGTRSAKTVVASADESSAVGSEESEAEESEAGGLEAGSEAVEAVELDVEAVGPPADPQWYEWTQYTTASGEKVWFPLLGDSSQETESK